MTKIFLEILIPIELGVFKRSKKVEFSVSGRVESGRVGSIIFGTNVDFEPWNMNILAMNKRLSISLGFFNHQKYEFLVFLVMKNRKIENIEKKNELQKFKKCSNSNTNT